jgi:hypothetical protein
MHLAITVKKIAYSNAALFKLSWISFPKPTFRPGRRTRIFCAPWAARVAAAGEGEVATIEEIATAEGCGPFCQPDYPLGVSIARDSRTAVGLARGAVGHSERASQSGPSTAGGTGGWKPERTY